MAAKGKKSKALAAATTGASTYVHVEEKNLMRPDIGTQAQFKKRKEPKKYRYDSSLSPALDYDGQNPAREQGEALIRQAADEIRRAARRRRIGLVRPWTV
jgi:adenine-specific DNA-methyltransferase